MSENDIEYQIGSKEIDTSPTVTDNKSNVVEFDFEAGAVFKRLADDIYETPEAGIREPLTNSITTVRRTEQENDEGVIEITVQDGEQVKLQIRDSGEGISKAKLEEVLTVVGRSDARDDGDLSGMYGMGFLASYKLVGMDGGFLMCTNPRDPEKEAYRGVFKPGVFEYSDDQEDLRLSGDNYGTLFEYYVKDSISVSNIRDWVEKHAKWSPVPVIYKELDKDGNVRENEDYNSNNLTDNYGDMPSIHIDEEYYEVATSPESDSNIILISSPVDMHGTRTVRKNLPWSVDIRLKYENGVVFKGPNEGLVPIDASQYDSLDENRKDMYIAKEDLEKSDMCLPEPTGTREKLRKNKSFLTYLNKNLMDRYIDLAQDALDEFDPTEESLDSISKMSKHIILRIFQDFDSKEEYSKSYIKNRLSNGYDYDNPSEDLIEFIQTMTTDLKVLSEPKNYKKEYPKIPVYKLNNRDSSTFMTISGTSWKAKAVEKSGNDLVKVENADSYDPYIKHLDWKPTKEIKKSDGYETLEMDEDTFESIYSVNSSTAEEIDERTLTIHYRSGGRTNKKKKVSEVKDLYDGSSYYGDVLVLFPRTGEHNLSDHYKLADNSACVASAGKKVTKKLEKVDNIVRYSEYNEWVAKRKVYTNHGKVSISRLLNNNKSTVFYIRDFKDNHQVTNESILESVARGVTKVRNDVKEVPNFALIDKDYWTHLTNVEDLMDTSSCMTMYYGSIGKVITQHLNEQEVELYLADKFGSDYKEYSECEVLSENHRRITNKLVNKTELLEKSKNMNNGFKSRQNTAEPDSKRRLPVLKTKHGNLTIDEVYDRYDPSNVVLHVVNKESIQKFLKGDFLAAGATRLSKMSKTPDLTDGVYVPIIKSEFNAMEEYINKETTVIGTWNSRINCIPQVNKRMIYAYLTLYNWTEDTIEDVCGSGGDFEEFCDYVDTIKEAHDNKISPEISST